MLAREARIALGASRVFREAICTLFTLQRVRWFSHAEAWTTYAWVLARSVNNVRWAGCVSAVPQVRIIFGGMNDASSLCLEHETQHVESQLRAVDGLEEVLLGLAEGHGFFGAHVVVDAGEVFEALDLGV
jgi:hypothetical protein